MGENDQQNNSSKFPRTKGHEFQIEKGHQMTRRTDKNRHTHRFSIIKLQKSEDKEKII